MPLLTRDQILDASDLPTEDVDVPEWGGTVRVRGLSGRERDALEAEVVERRGRKTSINVSNFRAKLAARSIVDDDGKRVFSDNDIKALGEKSAVALQRVFDVASRLSGISESDMEELEKNLTDGQSDDFTSN